MSAAAAGGGRGQKAGAWFKTHKPEALLGMGGIAVAIYLYEKQKSSSSTATTATGAGTLSPGTGGGGDWSFLGGSTSAGNPPGATSTPLAATGPSAHTRAVQRAHATHVGDVQRAHTTHVADVKRARAKRGLSNSSAPAATPSNPTQASTAHATATASNPSDRLGGLVESNAPASSRFGIGGAPAITRRA